MAVYIKALIIATCYKNQINLITEVYLLSATRSHHQSSRMQKSRLLVHLCVTILAVISVVSTAQAAPHSSKQNQDLEKSFAQFVQQDEELQGLIQKYHLGDGTGLTRHVRQAEDVENIEQDTEGGSKEGFFDRAAKFVMEVLQRFLKWVNSDN